MESRMLVFVCMMIIIIMKKNIMKKKMMNKIRIIIQSEHELE